MLTILFSKYYRRYLWSPAGDWLEDFADRLVSVGYARDPAQNHVRRLRKRGHGTVT